MADHKSEHLKLVTENYLKHADSGAKSMSVAMADGGGTGGRSMDDKDIPERLARIEGGWTIMQWAVGIVSTAIVGGMALLLGLTTLLWSNLNQLDAKVDTLPSEIRRELQDLNSSMTQAIQATRTDNAASVQVPPQVIYIPTPSTNVPFPVPQPPETSGP